MSLPTLAALLQADRSPASPVAWGRAGEHGWAEFTGRVAALAARLEGARGSRFVVDVADSFGFAVALFALARAGAVGVLPPNRQPGTRARLAADTQGVLADGPDAPPAALRVDGLPPDPAPRPVALDPHAPWLELYTSGTTGEAKPVPKSLRHLDEVAELEQVFGGGLPREVAFFATASHQHLYGLLFRVLWPLAAGRPFQAETYLHPEELLPRMVEREACVLVATPAHLRRMAARGALRPLRGRCRRVFSSGGPLDPETAAAVARDLGSPPVEIFGSTETGGVAWRGGESARERWSPLPSVRVDREPDSGRLRVRSPFVSAGVAAPGDAGDAFTLGDRVALDADGRFALLGRADRVVKVGEKRLALPEMESRLRAHALVSEAALLTLEQGPEDRVAAVVVPSPEGDAARVRGGRRELARRLAEQLATDFDRVLLPRAWRFVAALPRDERGKTPLDALRALFAEAGARPREPLLLAERREADALVRELEVPEDLAYLEGHFEGLPVVPGVVQLGWVVDAASALLGAPPHLQAVEALKFHELLRPGDRLALHLERDAREPCVRFRLADGPRLFGSGRLRLEDAG